MAERSAKQKAATKRMVAANKARREGGSAPKKKSTKGAKKKSVKKTSSGSGLSARVKRLEHDMGVVNAWAPAITEVVNTHSRQISTLGALVKRFGGPAAAKKLKAAAKK